MLYIRLNLYAALIRKQSGQISGNLKKISVLFRMSESIESTSTRFVLKGHPF
jgi:hypothetical protein